MGCGVAQCIICYGGVAYLLRRSPHEGHFTTGMGAMPASAVMQIHVSGAIWQIPAEGSSVEK